MKGVFWHASGKSTKMKMVGSVFNRDKRVKFASEGALNPLGKTKLSLFFFFFFLSYHVAVQTRLIFIHLFIVRSGWD